GTSMGGMHTWMWGEMYPDYMDGLVPIASQPVAIGGQNWLMRRLDIEAIRNDPDWKDGNYEKKPTHWIHPAPLSRLGTGSALRFQKPGPTRRAGGPPFPQVVEATG